MEQIQFNCAANTATVSQNDISESGEKTDLFPKMLLEQRNAPTVTSNCAKKDCSQNEDGKADGNAKTKADKTDGAEGVNQQPLLVTDWFVPIMQGKSIGPPNAEIAGLNGVGKVAGASQDLSVETEGVTVTQVEVGFPDSGGVFSAINSANGNGGQAVNYCPVQVGQMPSLVTGSAFVAQAASVLQASNPQGENPLTTDYSQSQSSAAILSEVANGSMGFQRLRVVNQPVSVYVEKNALKPSLQSVPGMVSETGQAGVNEPKATAVQTGQAASVQTAETFGPTNMPVPPKNTLPAETLQPSKTGSQIQMVVQDQNAGQAKSQSTVCTEVLMHSQNTEHVKINDQSQSTDDSGSQSTVRPEVLGQTQTFEQVKSTDQSQNAVRSQVIYQVNTHFSKGDKEFEMQLYPKDLGKVNVKMTVEGKTIVVEICAASSKAQSIILANADDIKAILQSQVNRDIQISLPQDQKAPQQQLFNDEQANHQNPHFSKDQQSEENEDEDQKVDTGRFLNALNMFGEKYFTERSQDYAG